MGRKSNNAEAKDAQIKFEREECASSMVQRKNASDAALKGAQI